jgi:hypothetical protein
MTAPAYIPIPPHPEYAGASEEVEHASDAPDISSLPNKPCLSLSGLWLFFAAPRRAFTKLLVMLGLMGSLRTPAAAVVSRLQRRRHDQEGCVDVNRLYGPAMLCVRQGPVRTMIGKASFTAPTVTTR